MEHSLISENFIDRKVCIHLKLGGVVGGTKFVIARIKAIEYDGLFVTINDKRRSLTYNGWLNLDNITAITEYMDKSEANDEEF